MIVVDNDVLSYFWIAISNRSESARRVRAHDENWIAPRIWRSEFRNVLRSYILGDYMTLAEAQSIAREAEADLARSTFGVDTDLVLQLAAASGHSAYDCEYVALAQTRDLPLVTGDKQLAARFPNTAHLLESFAAQ
ncbi:MAG: type II toxin-antitoxin system VapC family toxin [Longimonas sp.]|uniref:type II toxin-antitoxin system VapC family toxin n=1 Tax=Longimonas sp. TaxID=2039626 RepID=UPI003976C9FF